MADHCSEAALTRSPGARRANPSMDEIHRVPAPAAPRLGRPVVRARVSAAARLAGPVAGGLTALGLSWNSGTPLESTALAVVALLAGTVVAGGEPGWARLLPLMGALARALGALLGGAVLLFLASTGVLVGLGTADAWIIALVSLVASLALAPAARTAVERRQVAPIAVIGSARSAESLDREIRLSGIHDYRVVGRVTYPGDAYVGDGDVPVLGDLSDLGSIVERHGVSLLLMAGETPRMTVFEEVARSCLHLPVHLRELSGFYEEAFGHVAVAEINAAWFQWIVHPNYRARSLPGERLFDVVIAGVAGLVALPLVAVFALLIRRDGGPVLFRQVRIGEGGRRFMIYKLRTMRDGAAGEWATAVDSRVTPIGRFLRRTHLDELPQVLNVLRGEMSIVGPRPEQPEFVDRLETVIPFYQRRHLMRPGLTGWAQVRCGYAGSDVGSAWKVCHDLYYLKHRSVSLNLVILGETLRTVVADRQYSAQPATVDFILAPTRTALDAGPRQARPRTAS
jgi:exopolysaccharide biosynthesis polyprenyl glycosylphosphotransferase